MVTLPDVAMWDKMRRKITSLQKAKAIVDVAGDDHLFPKEWFETIAKEIMDGSLLNPPNHKHVFVPPMGGGVAGDHSHAITTSIEVSPREDWSADCRARFGPIGLIAMRLNKYTKGGKLPGVDAIFIHEAPEKTFVFVVTTEGNAVTLTDSKDLFPSDTLITQLRLLGT